MFYKVVSILISLGGDSKSMRYIVTEGRTEGNTQRRNLYINDIYFGLSKVGFNLLNTISYILLILVSSSSRFESLRIFSFEKLLSFSY